MKKSTFLSTMAVVISLTLLAPFLAYVYADESGDLDFFCETDGFFAHPLDPRLYIKCSHGEGVVKRCPPSLHFNPIMRRCDYPELIPNPTYPGFGISIDAPWEKVCHPRKDKCTWRFISTTGSCEHYTTCWK